MTSDFLISLCSFTEERIISTFGWILMSCCMFVAKRVRSTMEVRVVTTTGFVMYAFSNA